MKIIACADEKEIADLKLQINHNIQICLDKRNDVISLRDIIKGTFLDQPNNGYSIFDDYGIINLTALIIKEAHEDI